MGLPGNEEVYICFAMLTTIASGSRYGMDMVVPVDDQGCHTDYAGKYAGMKTGGV